MQKLSSNKAPGHSGDTIGSAKSVPIDIVQAYQRCFSTIANTKQPKKSGGNPIAALLKKLSDAAALSGEASGPSAVAVINAINRVWPFEYLTLDNETWTKLGTNQALRFGYYQLRGLPYDHRYSDHTLLAKAAAGTLSLEDMDRVTEHGFFYSPDMNEADLATIKSFVNAYNARCENGEPKLTLMVADLFVNDVLFAKTPINNKRGYYSPKLVVGHNPIFDMGRLMNHVGEARATFHNGLSGRLCTCKHYDCKCPPLMNHDGKEAVDKFNTAVGCRCHLLKEHSCRYHPRFAFLKVGGSKYMTKFSGRREEDIDAALRADAADMGEGDNLFTHPFRLVDTIQLTRALHGAGMPGSLRALARHFKLSAQKQHTRHDQSITRQYLGYCISDVETTAKLFQLNRNYYNTWGCDTPIYSLVSEATAGKAIKSAIGYRPFLEQNPDFPEDIMSLFMAGYAGGAVSVNLRLMIALCKYFDFKSQYSLVCCLMKLQDIELAERCTYGRLTEGSSKAFEVLEFIRAATKESVLDKAAWPMMRAVVLIEDAGRVYDEGVLAVGRHCIMPVRSAFRQASALSGIASFPSGAIPSSTGLAATANDMSTINVGLCDIVQSPPMWVTVPDLLGSKFRMRGLLPKILDVVVLIPSVEKYPTNVINLLGDPEFPIDVQKDDLFATLINCRDHAKGLKKLPGADIAALDQKEQSIKILASATSYGSLVEVRDDEHSKPVWMNVWGAGEYVARQANAFKNAEHTEQADFKSETPGKFFFGGGALIPAAGRLLVTLAELFALDHGIGIGGVDTDATIFIKPTASGTGGPLLPIQSGSMTAPPSMTSQAFEAACASIQAKFQSLNVFASTSPIFEAEKVNFDKGGKSQPLYFFGVSSKRYALFNIKHHDVVIRKATGHGAQHIHQPAHYDPDGTRFEQSPTSWVGGHELVKPCAADHEAAPLKSQKELEDDRVDYPDAPPWPRKYGVICRGPSPRLMLDLWRQTICFYLKDASSAAALTSEFIENYTGIAFVPQAVRASMVTRDAWRKVSKVMPGIKPGGFYQQLPEPHAPEHIKVDPAVAELFKHGLFADAGRVLSLRKKDYLQEDGTYAGLYWDHTMEFPHELFDNPLVDMTPHQIKTMAADLADEPELLARLRKAQCTPRIQTIADALHGYFNSCEYKSFPHDGVGQLQRRRVIISGIGFTGKSVNRLSVLSEGASVEEASKYSGNRIAIEAGLDVRLLACLDLDMLSKRSRINRRRLEGIMQGEIIATGNDAREITAALFADEHGVHVHPCEEEESPLDIFIKQRETLIDRLGSYGAACERVIECLELETNTVERLLSSPLVSLKRGAIHLEDPDKMLLVPVKDVYPVALANSLPIKEEHKQGEKILASDGGNFKAVPLELWQFAFDELMGVNAARQARKTKIIRDRDRKAKSKSVTGRAPGTNKDKTAVIRRKPLKKARAVAEALSKTLLKMTPELMHELTLNTVVEPLRLSASMRKRSDLGLADCIAEAHAAGFDDAIDVTVRKSGRGYLPKPTKDQVKAAERLLAPTADIVTPAGQHKQANLVEAMENEAACARMAAKKTAEETRMVARQRDREAKDALKAAGCIWYGMHKGTLWAELDDEYIDLVGGSKGATSEAKAEFDLRRSDPNSILFDEDVYLDALEEQLAQDADDDDAAE